MTGYKNELLLPTAFDQSFLEIDPVQSRHPHIDNHA